MRRSSAARTSTFSPSTRAIDRREKLDAYLKLSSLRQYLIADQRRRHVLSYSRPDENAEWLRDEIEGEGDIGIPFLETTDCSIEEIASRVLERLAIPRRVRP